MIFFFSVKNPFDVILTQNDMVLQVCFHIFFKNVIIILNFVKNISIPTKAQSHLLSFSQYRINHAIHFITKTYHLSALTA